MGKYYTKVKNPSGASGTKKAGPGFAATPTGQLAREGKMLKTQPVPQAQAQAQAQAPPTGPQARPTPPSQGIPVPQATLRAVQGTPGVQPGVQQLRSKRTTKQGTYSPY